MGVLCGAARISETGDVTGRSGDQTGTEVMTQDWYAYPWDYMITPKDAALGHKAAQNMIDACANDAIGYDQNERTTAYISATEHGYSFKSAAGETDCSELAGACYILAGVNISPYVYTGNIRAALMATGQFNCYADAGHVNSDAYAVEGALYLKEGVHIIMALQDKGGAVVIPDEPISSGLAAGHGVCNTDGLRIRTAPVDGNILAQMYTGDTFTVNGTQNGWLYIRFNDVVGWASGEYCSYNAPQSTPQAPATANARLANILQGQKDTNEYLKGYNVKALKLDGDRRDGTELGGRQVMLLALNRQFGMAWDLNLGGNWWDIISQALGGNYVSNGDNNELARAVQINLELNGYSVGQYGANASFGNDSEGALKAYQSDHGLTADGKAGAGTIFDMLA